MEKSIYNFFYPSSICIAGASSKEFSLGYEVLKNIKLFNYSGKVLPVNPKADVILGFKCYHSIESIDIEIDLAIILVPKKFTIETIEQLLSKGVKSLLLITAGFKETGEKGAKLENEILYLIKDANARMVGPNCMGIINSLSSFSLNSTFISEMPVSGKIAFMSQSGALGATILNSLRKTNLKFAHFISVGNKADLNENDFLRFWEKDKNINVLTYYLESFDNGLEFIKPFLLSEIQKPVVVLKAGKTKSGIKAASSHTGALSSEDRVVESLLRQSGVIRVETVNELFNTANGFETFPMPKGNKIAIVTNAGGPAILATDKLDTEGLVLSELCEETKLKLKTIVHPEGSVNNPIDLLPSGNDATFAESIRILVEDENVDAVISIFVEPGFISPIDVANAVDSIQSEKPILQVVMPKPEFWSQLRELTEITKTVFRNPEEPAEVIANMLFHSSLKTKRERSKEEITKLFSLSTKNPFSFNAGFITQSEIREICNHYKFPMVKEISVNVDDIAKTEIDFYPIVVKGISTKAIHKSEFDAVKLNIKNKNELLKAVEEIKLNFEKVGIEIEELLIQEFISTKHEILLGGYRDSSFGPVIMFGSGGKYVEVFNDTAIRSAFISRSEISEMILSTAMGKILAGVRNEAPINMENTINLVQNSALMLIENERISEFDFNPIIVDMYNELHAVDVRIKFE